MQFLLLSICCSVAVAHVFKYAESKHFPTFPLLSVNYFMGSLIALWGAGFHLSPESLRSVFGLGIPLGALFVWCFVVFIWTVRELGMVIPVSLMRLSAVIPTLGSIMFFSEQPSGYHLAGLILAFIALPLASREPLLGARWRSVLRKGFGWGLVLFVSFGLTDFLFKVQIEMFPIGNIFELLSVIFPVALLITVTVALIRREKYSRPVVLTGAALGVLNVFSAYFFISALGELPGIIVYPSNGIGIISLSVVVAMVVWKERPALRNYGFFVLAAIALLLITR